MRYIEISTRIVLLNFLLLFWNNYLYAQTGISKNRPVLRVKHTIDFDITGSGTAAQWNGTEWIPIAQRNSKVLRDAGWHISAERIEMKDVKYETNFKILYSDKGFYCLFQCEDSVITATLKADFADLFNEDVVEVFLWPDTSLPVYFEYELSPLNYELPILIFNNKGNSAGWRPWKYESARKIIHAVKVNEKNMVNGRISWTAEFFIPFRLLHPFNNVPPKKGTRWRANFYRIDYDLMPVYSSWQLTRRSFHDYENFGILEFE